MKKSELTKMIQETIKVILKESNGMDDFDSSYADADAKAYDDHLSDLGSGISDEHMGDIETLLMRICAKFKKAQGTKESELIAQAIQHLEQVDQLLGEDVMEEGLGHDRQMLVSQVQTLGKKIATRAAFTKLPDGSMAVMVSNLEAIANKLN